MNAPPIGVRPRWSWDEARVQEISEALVRYSEAKKDIPLEWIDELRELSVRLEDARPERSKT